MRIIGIDPGFGRLGVAVIDGTIGHVSLVDACCIETSAHSSFPDRLHDLSRQFHAVLDSYVPQVAAMEKLFFATNRTTAMHVSEARGVLLLACAEHGIPVEEYSPPEVKLAVAGYGDAPKHQVAQMVQHMLHRTSSPIPGPDDVLDACAIALTHLHRAPLARMAAIGKTKPLPGRTARP